MTQETVTNGTEALFTREGMPPVKEMIPCALQHVLASFAGIITPAVIMAGVYGFNSQQSTDIIQVALILSAIDTALQAFAPFRRIGGGLPIVMGVSFAFLPALQAMGASGFSFGALLGGEIQLVVDVIAGWKPLIEAGRARGRIVGSATRSTVLPDIPNNVEAGYPRWVVNSSGNMWAPAKTPPDIIATLNKAQQEFLKMPDVMQMLLTNGSQPQPSTPDELRQILISQMEFWSEAARAANFKPE